MQPQGELADGHIHTNSLGHFLMPAFTAEMVIPSPGDRFATSNDALPLETARGLRHQQARSGLSTNQG
jgi:hypothetical protein